jgi:hypothetical protein
VNGDIKGPRLSFASVKGERIFVFNDFQWEIPTSRDFTQHDFNNPGILAETPTGPARCLS